jgi:hypothetical protein
VVVEPVDPAQGGGFDVFDRAPGAAAADEFGLEQPITDSARALSSASPTAPTESSIPAAARRSVKAIDVYCDPLSW